MKYRYTALFALIYAFSAVSTHPGENSGAINALGSTLQGLQNNAPWAFGATCLGLAGLNAYYAAQNMGVVPSAGNNEAPGGWLTGIKAALVVPMFAVGGNHFVKLQTNAPALQGAVTAFKNAEQWKAAGETGQWLWNNAPHIVPIIFAAQVGKALYDSVYGKPVRGNAKKNPDSTLKAGARTAAWFAAAKVFAPDLKTLFQAKA